MKKELMQKTKEIFAKYGIDFSGQAFSYGNRRLKTSDLVVNITSAAYCPSAELGMCEIPEDCYARRLEAKRCDYFDKNLAVEEFFQKASMIDILTLLFVYIDHSPMPIKRIRLNEAGDFPNQETVELFNEISGIMKKVRGITTYAWTSRKDLDFRESKFIVNGSSPGVKGADRVYRCISQEDFDRIISMHDSRLSAEKSLAKQGIALCKGPGGCKHCGICATRNNIDLVWARKF